jgi:type II secretory pathway pseudopilin PulG
MALLLQSARWTSVYILPPDAFMKEINVSSKTSARGFTVIEATVVVLIVGLVAAFSVPRITNAMREYRVNLAVRQMTDMIQRAKMQAVSENNTVILRVDTVNNKAGIVTLDSGGNEVSVQYVPLPQGVRFVLPTPPAGSTLPPPMTGAPVSASVSFPAKAGSTGVYEQGFNSRGFPAVAAGTISAIYVGSNNQSYAALTINSVGGLRSWKWSNNQWVNVRAANPSS